MEINRSNYEIWLIDLLEGNLSKTEAEQVTLFLEQNPDIGDEFDALKSPAPKISEGKFKHKESIRKSAAEIPDSQFELLCVSFHEGDLGSESSAELREILDSSADRRKTFDLFGKLRLVPSSAEYKNKKLLLRITPVQRVLRNSLIGLSMAAALALFISISFLTVRYFTDKSRNTASDFPVFPSLEEKYFEIPAGSAIRIYHSVNLQIVKRTEPVNNYTAAITVSDTVVKAEVKESTEDLRISSIPITMICLTADEDRHLTGSSSLIPMKPFVNIHPEEVYMSNVERFVAKVFREKILGEKVTKETPLKAYEIAEAGVEGLNKLLGWEMALNERNDENGELKSVYFSSKILKFNAPVKKPEEGQ
jgi:hypothetical protein